MADIPRIAGLHTAPNHLSAVPPGATTEAENVIFASPGIVEPRRGLVLQSYTPSTTQPITGFFYFDGKLFCHVRNTGGIYYDTGAAWTQVTDLAAEALTPGGDRDTIGTFEAKQTLFISSYYGARRLEDFSGTIKPATPPKGFDISKSTANTSVTAASKWLTANSTVAYRYTWGYKDQFGRLIEGAPSGRYLFSNGADCAPVLYIPAFYGSTTDYFVRLYRTESVTTGEPGDDCYLIKEQRISKTPIVYAAYAGPGTERLSKANGVSVVTASNIAHGLSTGDYVMVSTQTSTGTNFMNGIFGPITVTNSTTFTYDDGLVNSTGATVYNTVIHRISPCLVLTDYTPDIALEDPLYTNPSDGATITSENDAPPGAADAVWWGDTAFYANTKGPQRFTLRLLGVSGSAVKAELDLDTPSADLDTVVRAKTAGAAGNSITVAAVGDSAPAAGVTISEAGNAVTIHFESGVSTVANVETAIGTSSTLIEVKTAGTGATVLTAGGPPGDAFSATALAGGVDTDDGILPDDTLKFEYDSVVYTFTAKTTVAAPFQFALATSGTASENIQDTITNLCNEFNWRLYGRARMYKTGVLGEVLIELISTINAQAKIYASKPASWAPYLTTTNGTGCLTTTAEVCPARVYYSKLGQPEAVPMLNYLDVGDTGKKIQRVAALSDGVYVIKEDGIFVITGQAPFSVDVVDPTQHVFEPETVAVGDNRIFGLSSEGVFSISSGNGVQKLGTPIEDKFCNAADYLNEFRFGGINPASSQYILTMQNFSYLLVYNYRATAWSTWTLPNSRLPKAIFERPEVRSTDANVARLPKLVIACLGDTSNTGALFENKAMGANGHLDYYDLASTGTVSSAAANSCTFTPGAGQFAAAAGDVLKTGSTYFRITAINGSALTVMGTPANGAGTVYRAATAKVTLAPFTAGSLGTAKQFRGAHVHFQSYGFNTGTLKFRTNHSPAQTTTNVGNYTTTNFQFPGSGTLLAGSASTYGVGNGGYLYSLLPPATKRVAVPASEQRGAALQIGFQCSEALAPFRLTGFSIDLDQKGERSDR